MKTLLVGHQFLIREALRGIIEELKSDALVMEVTDGPQAMQLLSQEADIGLVIVDLDQPDRNGLSALRELRDCYPEVPVVAISSAQDRDSILEALALGARGFLLKSGERRIMLMALKLVLAGGTYIPPEVLARERSALVEPLSARDAAPTPTFNAAGLGLTGRQFDVLAAMMQGKRNKAICRDLNLAQPTVKNHVTAILRQLGVSNRVEAVLAVGALGWQPPGAERVRP
jgi:DNA-binding NarL/FixJ family response regulator